MSSTRSFGVARVDRAGSAAGFMAAVRCGRVVAPVWLAGSSTAPGAVPAPACVGDTVGPLRRPLVRALVAGSDACKNL